MDTPVVAAAAVAAVAVVVVLIQIEDCHVHVVSCYNDRKCSLVIIFYTIARTKLAYKMHVENNTVNAHVYAWVSCFLFLSEETFFFFTTTCKRLIHSTADCSILFIVQWELDRVVPNYKH